MDEIERLERWHRDWEIRNRDRLLVPTFATWDEFTHDHEWVFSDRFGPDGQEYDKCDRCWIVRMHVPGTLSRRQRLYRIEDDLKQRS